MERVSAHLSVARTTYSLGKEVNAADTAPVYPLVVEANANAISAALRANMAPYLVLAWASSRGHLRLPFHANLFFRSDFNIICLLFA